MLSACGGGNAAPANAAPAHASSAHSAAAGEASGWQTVATFKGDGGADYKSADFTVPAGKVRVVWTVQPNDVGPVPMMWEIDGTVNGSDLAYGGSSCPACDGQQTYDVGPFRTGSYHLKVLTSRPWTLAVEEQS